MILPIAITLLAVLLLVALLAALLFGVRWAMRLRPRQRSIDYSHVNGGQEAVRIITEEARRSTSYSSAWAREMFRDASEDRRGKR
jgi:hypothetical protein